MRAKEFIVELMDQSELDVVKNFCDELWGRLGIDVVFTRHFIDRLNDERNGKQITPGELMRLFRKEYQAYGANIAELPPDTQAVMTDVMTKINLPFVITGAGENKELFAKTIMRKENFKSASTSYKIR